MRRFRSKPVHVVKHARVLKTRLVNSAGGKFGLLLLALVALITGAPLIIANPISNAFIALLTGGVLVSGLHAARPGGRPVIIGIGLTLADFAIGRGMLFYYSHWLALLQLVLWIFTLTYVTIVILGLIFESQDVTLDTLLASLCVYLLIGFLGSFVLALIDFSMPGSFQPTHGPVVNWAIAESRETEFLRLLVFSYSTLSGSSFTEIAPATSFAGNVVSFEAMAGQFYLAVVIARLVGLYTTERMSD